MGKNPDTKRSNRVVVIARSSGKYRISGNAPKHITKPVSKDAWKESTERVLKERAVVWERLADR